MCDKVVKDDPSFLQFVPNWFFTKEWIDMWYDDDRGKSFEWYDDDKDNFFELYDDDNDDDDKYNLFEWCNWYKNQKAQKSSIKDELVPIAWHPSRYWDWCMSEDEKQETEKLWT